MQKNSDVNPAFAAWKLSVGPEKEWLLQELIRRLEKFAKAICWHRLPDHHTQLDAIVNEIVWRAIKQADKFKANAKFSTWFYRIAINQCNTYLRAFKERYETELVDESPSRIEILDARIDLIDLLNGLKEPDHLLFRLVAEGQDFQTIGKELGVSRNAALVRWTRLKRRLKNAAL